MLSSWTEVLFPLRRIGAQRPAPHEAEARPRHAPCAATTTAPAASHAPARTRVPARLCLGIGDGEARRQ